MGNNAENEMCKALMEVFASLAPPVVALSFVKSESKPFHSVELIFQLQQQYIIDYIVR